MKTSDKKVGLYKMVNGISFPPGYRDSLLATVPLKKIRGAVQLSDLIQKDVIIDWRRVCTLTIDLCSRLAVSHRNGIAHGKIEPCKIVVEQEQGMLRNARLVNPSILSSSNANDNSSWDKTAFPYFAAEHFRSPEQIAGRAATPASDVYALGAVMYAALTGSPPAVQRQRNIFEKEDASNLNAYQVPAQLEKIVMRCLSQNPHDRYANADELLSAIAWWDPWLDKSENPRAFHLLPFEAKSLLYASAIMTFIGLIALLIMNLAGTNEHIATNAASKSGISITINLSPEKWSVKTAPGVPAVSRSVQLVADDD